MPFIILTYFPESEGNITVNSKYIVCMEREEEATKIYFPVHSEHGFMTWARVKETPEEIIRMIREMTGGW